MKRTTKPALRNYEVLQMQRQCKGGTHKNKADKRRAQKERRSEENAW